MSNSSMITDIAFFLGIGVLAFLLWMMLLSLLSEKTQYWPPPGRETWQYQTLWWGIRTLIVCIAIVIYTNHSTWNIPHSLRYYLALPIFVCSFAIGSIAAFQLGWKNTHGIADRFVERGMYKISRNPQYVLYAISFLSLAVFVASIKAAILLSLLAIWYLLAPFPEEKWLEREYGEAYTSYKAKVSRYLGRGGAS